MKNLIKKNQLMITALAIMIAIAGYLQFAGSGLEDDYLTVNDTIDYTDDASAVDSGGIITENYTIDGLLDLSDEDMLDLSGENLLSTGLTDIESLDSDKDEDPVGNYLGTGMEIVDAGTEGAQAAGSSPEEGEIPGEAVFTSSEVTVVLTEAKLLREQTRALNQQRLMEIINSAELSDEMKQNAVDSLIQMTENAEKEAAAEILLEAKGFTDVVVSINGNQVDVVVNAASLDDAMRAQIEDIVKRKTEIPAENIIISTVER